MKKVIAGRTILLNTVTNCTFVAGELDDQVQIGTRDSDKHIDWCGELSFSYIRCDAGSAIKLIQAERQRQIEQERWTPEHDDAYQDDQLIMAATSYALADRHRKFNPGTSTAPVGWPFDEDWFKPSPDDRVRELVKAGALIAAEIDRLVRLKEASVPSVSTQKWCARLMQPCANQCTVGTCSSVQP